VKRATFDLNTALNLKNIKVIFRVVTYRNEGFDLIVEYFITNSARELKSYMTKIALIICMYCNSKETS